MTQPHLQAAFTGGSTNGRKRGSDDEYLSAGDAARLLCVSARTVSRWADQGRIPHLVTLGGHRRFSKANIIELSRQSRRDSEEASTGN